MKKIYTIGVLACLFAACKPNVNVTTTPTQGEADFTNYLAIGSSYTAGFADNSLYVTGQLNSFPERLFEQFSLVGAKGPFVQPLLPGEYGYPRPKKVLWLTHSLCNFGDSSLSPVDYPNPLDSVGSARFVSTVNNGQINNIGTPGLRVVDYPVVGWAVQAAPNGFPYAQRFYHTPSSTPMEELAYRVHTLHPTFFTFWMGMDDVLGYALSGGQGDGSANVAPQLLNYFNPKDISNIVTFESFYDTAVNMSISTGSNGALINIPDITAFPFFTTVPANGLTINTQAQVDALQARYKDEKWNKVFELGASYFVIEDHNGKIRQAVPGELIMLSVPMDSIKCYGWGATTPIPARYVLTTDELQNIRNFTRTANLFIQNRALIHHLAYVDINTYMAQLSTGMTYNGVNYSTQFVQGGAFSLDGVHPTQRGYALISNEMIRVINNFYHSTMPLTDVNKYHGINFP